MFHMDAAPARKGLAEHARRCSQGFDEYFRHVFFYPRVGASFSIFLDFGQAAFYDTVYERTND